MKKSLLFTYKTFHILLSTFFFFFSSSNPFLAENSCVVGEGVAATQTNVATIVRNDIATSQTDIEDDDVWVDITNDIVASIDPPSAISSDFFGHLPQPELTSCTGD